MQMSDLLAVIAVAIALSAYLSTVRFRLLDKSRKRYAKALMLADVPLVASSSTLAVCIGLKCYANKVYPDAIAVGLCFFGLALIVLVCFHIYEWGISWDLWK